MALIDCPECGKQISDEANYCSQCGSSLARDSETSSDSLKKDNAEYVACALCGNNMPSNIVTCSQCGVKRNVYVKLSDLMFIFKKNMPPLIAAILFAPLVIYFIDQPRFVFFMLVYPLIAIFVLYIITVRVYLHIKGISHVHIFRVRIK